jgi:hypothetical protein
MARARVVTGDDRLQQWKVATDRAYVEWIAADRNMRWFTKYYNQVKISNPITVMENIDIKGAWESYYREY